MQLQADAAAERAAKEQIGTLQTSNHALTQRLQKLNSERLSPHPSLRISTTSPIVTEANVTGNRPLTVPTNGESGVSNTGRSRQLSKRGVFRHTYSAYVYT